MTKREKEMSEMSEMSTASGIVGVFVTRYLGMIKDEGGRLRYQEWVFEFGVLDPDHTHESDWLPEDGGTLVECIDGVMVDMNDWLRHGTPIAWFFTERDTYTGGVIHQPVTSLQGIRLPAVAGARMAEINPKSA